MPERGQIVMLKMLEILSEIGVPESLPKLENNKWIAIIKPRKKN
jgi:translation initiation factor IF-3